MTEVFNNMKVPYTAPTVVQQSNNVQPVTIKEAVASSSVGEQKSDTVELSTNKEKKHPVKAVKGFISDVKKFFANLSEYSMGTLNGLKNGIIGASLVYTGGAAINKIRQSSADKVAKKAGEEVAQVVKKVPNKFIAIVVGAGALAASLWNASLNASERGSNIEHRYVGHNK